MTLSDVDLAALAAVFNGILHDPGISVTGDYLACEVLAAASENEEDRKLIISMYDRGMIAKSPDDRTFLGEIAEEPYRLNDLAERLRELTDAEAMAAFVRVQEILEAARGPDHDVED